MLTWWRSVWRGEPDASDLAMQAEHRVARSRFAITLALTVFGALLAFQEPDHPDYLRAIPLNLGCLVLATVVLAITRRGERPTWLAAATSVGDVTVVSMLHVLELLQYAPSMAVNGRVTFMGYFLALVGTCVRWNRRIAVAAGIVAALQYLAIVAVARSMWPVEVTRDVAVYGQFDWGVQVERAIMLVLFGGVCGSIAQWAVRLREHATTDVLTGLMNRRTFEERMRDELLRARRHGTSISVVMFDVDSFKAINDEHGHQAGDVVLREVAIHLRRALRRTDLICRWGGEEFAVVFLDASIDAATRQADMLRTRIHELSLTVGNGAMLSVTLSGGVAATTTDTFQLEALMRAADARLLRAKRNGRNRIEAAEVDVAA